jgi:hypothetical protein
MVKTENLPSEISLFLINIQENYSQINLIRNSITQKNMPMPIMIFIQDHISVSLEKLSGSSQV